MIQRWCSKFRSIATVCSSAKPYHHHRPPLSNRLLHTSPNLLLHKRTTNIPFTSPTPFLNAHLLPHASNSPISLIQVRTITAKQKKRKMKSRQPETPRVSKMKKTKMKCYSSFKGRFRTMCNGEIRRWKAGKRHNAFAKSKKSKQRLRQPGVVHPAYAKVMKKLNFLG